MRRSAPAREIAPGLCSLVGRKFNFSGQARAIYHQLEIYTSGLSDEVKIAIPKDLNPTIVPEDRFISLNALEAKLIDVWVPSAAQAAFKGPQVADFECHVLQFALSSCSWAKMARIWSSLLSIRLMRASASASARLRS